MIKLLQIAKDAFLVFDETKKNGFRLSRTMIAVVLSMISWLAVRFTSIDVGMTDDEIRQVAEYFWLGFTVIFARLRFVTDRPVGKLPVQDDASMAPGDSEAEPPNDYPKH